MFCLGVLVVVWAFAVGSLEGALEVWMSLGVLPAAISAVSIIMANLYLRH